MTVQLHRPYREEWHLALPELLTGDRRIAVWTPLSTPPTNDQGMARESAWIFIKY